VTRVPSLADVEVRPYEPRDADAWDKLVRRSWNGTLLHTRRYVETFGARFADASLVVRDRGRGVVGVLPAARHVTDAAMAESHPALGYGGLVHDGSVRGPAMLAALEQVAERLFHDGFETLRYKATPAVYHSVPSGDDLYGLYRMGAGRSRCDLSSVVDLAGRPERARRRERSLAKAERAGLRVRYGAAELDAFWPVLTGRLAGKHDAEPLHTLEQLREVAALFPGEVDCVTARLGAETVAGVVRVRTGPVDHLQYIAASERGYEVSALDLLLERCLADASVARARYVSFGNSTLYGGRVFNENLYAFKSGFGAGSVVYEAYDLRLG
jgi:hypothetical protein